MTSNLRHSWLARYALAIAAVAAGVCLRWALTAWVGPGLPTYITFYPFVMLTALIAGVGPGILATMATVLAVDLWVVSPQAESGTHTLTDTVGQVFFCGVGVFISVVAGLYRRTRTRLQELVILRTRELTDANAGLSRQVEETTQTAKALDASRKAALNLMEDSVEARKLAERANAGLWQTYELLQAVTDGTEVIVAALDPGFRYLFFNNAYREEIKRLAGKEIRVGSSLLDTFAHMPEQAAIVRKQWQRTLSGEGATYRIAFGDPGRYSRVYSVRHTPIRNDQGVVIGAGEIAFDVTEQVKSEEALRRSEAAYTAAKVSGETVNAMSAGVVLTDMQGDVISVNPSFEKVAGYTAGEMAGKHAETLIREIVQPADLSRAREAFLKAQTGQPVSSLPLTIIAKNGSRIPLLAGVSHIRDAAGQPSAMVLTISDISDLKQAEEKLLKSQATLAEAQHIAHIGNWDWDIVTNALEWSDEVYRIFGLTPQAFGASYDAFLKSVHPDDRNLVSNLVNKALEGKQSYNIDHRIVRPDRSERIVHEQAEVFRDAEGRPVRMLGIVQDVTEHRQAEKRDRVISAFLALFARKSSRKEYLLAVVRLLRHASRCRCVGVRVIDTHDYIPYEASVGFNREFLQKESRLCLRKGVCACIRIVAGNPEPQDMPMMTPAGSFCCNDSAAFVGSLAEEEQARFRGNCVKHGFLSIGVIPIRHHDRILGAIHLADERQGMLPPDAVAFMEVVAPLIGEALFRFEVEESLRQAGVYNRSLIEASLDPLVTIDAEGKITDVNAATEKATGYPRTRLIGTDFADYFADPGLARAGYRQVFRDGWVQDYALEIQHRDGHVTPVLYNASRYRDEQGKIVGIFAAARDITERKRAEQVLEAYQAELRALSFRLSLAEERARRDLAVALHDTVGQTLAISKIKLGALGQLVTEPDARKELAEIREMFEEAVRQTRTLSFELSPPILYELGLDAALEWLGEEFEKRHGFQFRFECEDKKDVPESVSVLMFQAVRELLVNVGKHAQATHVRIVSRMEGQQLSILVKDDGKGFDPDAAAAAAARKASLGLFSIRERMRHIGGTFTVETQPGHGTTAVLRVPLDGKASQGSDGV